MNFKNLPPEIKSIVKDYQTFAAAVHWNIEVDEYAGGFDAYVEDRGLILGQGSGATRDEAIAAALRSI